MDYFQSQDVARKKTGLLIFYFVVAVILIILVGLPRDSGSIGVCRPDGRGRDDRGRVGSVESASVRMGRSRHFLADRRGEPLQIAASRTAGTRSPSCLVAGCLHPDGADREERRLLNVVEEMAIASGLPYRRSTCSKTSLGSTLSPPVMGLAMRSSPPPAAA